MENRTKPACNELGCMEYCAIEKARHWLIEEVAENSSKSGGRARTGED